MSGLTEYTEVNFGGREGPSDPNYRVGVLGTILITAGALVTLVLLLARMVLIKYAILRSISALVGA